MIGLYALQKDSRIIFVLRIPLVESETFKLFQIFPLRIQDEGTGLHHVILTLEKCIARNYDSMFYIPLPNIEKCKDLHFTTKLCEDSLPLPIDRNAICEAQLLKYQLQLPQLCQSSLILAQDYVKEIAISE